MQLCNAAGEWQVQVTAALEAAWWTSCCRTGGARWTWLATLYPLGLDFDWTASTHIFRRPVVEERGFVFLAAPPVLKWVARARSGALSTRARLVTARLASSPQCLCCSADLEDDQHAILGCPVTGSSDLSLLVPEFWVKACGAARLAAPPGWFTAHLPQLAVGLIPLSLRGLFVGAESWLLSIILRNFHVSLCERLADVLRRRERVMDEKASSSASFSTLPHGGVPRLPLRELTVAELRSAETAHPVPSSASEPAQPHSRAFRAQKQAAALTLQSWVKKHPHHQAVPLGQGEPSVALLLLWEADHKQFYPCGKADLSSRLNYFSKCLVDAVTADCELSGWLKHGKTRMTLSSGLRPTSNTRWAVRIRPEVGPSFLQAWKAHLRTLVHRQQHHPLPSSSAGASTRPSPRPQPALTRSCKRARSTPPLHTKKARVERLLAAQAALEASRRTSSSSSLAAMASLENRSFAGAPAGPLTLPPDLT